jgi:hypothetical protein
MISVPSAARLKARRRGYLLLVLAVNAIPGMLLTCDFRWSG